MGHRIVSNMMSPSSVALYAMLFMWWSQRTFYVSGLVPIALPQVVVTMRSTSPDTNTHDLLINTMRESTAFLDDYFSAYYNSTGTSKKYGFDHVSVSVKSNGVVPTASSVRYKTSINWFGTVYYRKANETATQVKSLLEYALNDNNRLLYIDNFLKKADNKFLQGITFMEVLIDGVMVGSPLPPLPQPATTSSNPSKKTNTAIGLTTALVILFVLAVVVGVFVVRRRRRQNKHPITPPQRNYGPVGVNSHPAFSFGRRNGNAVLLAAKALGSPSQLRADRDEEIAPHQGGQRGADVAGLFKSSSNRHRQTVAASDDIDVATLPTNHKEGGSRSPSKISLTFSKWQTDDVSQYNSVAMDVEAWKHFSSTSPPPKMPPPPTDPMKLATQVNNIGKHKSLSTATNPSNSSTSPKNYASPAWTSQNRFHFDIDEEDDDDQEEVSAVSFIGEGLTVAFAWH